jgi:hypothetical protein
MSSGYSKLRFYFLCASLVICLAGGISQSSAQTDQDVKRILVNESIAQYPGNCPCPYNTDRAGRRCGGRSAYSRRGGYAPLCYENDVTQKMVDDYRKSHRK